MSFLMTILMRFGKRFLTFIFTIFLFIFCCFLNLNQVLFLIPNWAGLVKIVKNTQENSYFRHRRLDLRGLTGGARWSPIWSLFDPKTYFVDKKEGTPKSSILLREKQLLAILRRPFSSLFNTIIHFLGDHFGVVFDVLFDVDFELFCNGFLRSFRSSKRKLCRDAKTMLLLKENIGFGYISRLSK